MYIEIARGNERGSDDLGRVTSLTARIAVFTSRPDVLAGLLPVLERGGFRAAVLPGRPDSEVAAACDLLLLDLDGQPREPAEFIEAAKGLTGATIIALSDRKDEASKVRALNAGASDYIVVPFGASELLARVQAALRDSTRSRSPAEAAVLIDPDLRVVRIAGRDIRLTQLEWRLFSVLARQAGQIVPHGRLLADVWGPAAERRVHYLRVYMNKLRNKLEPDPARPVFLLSIPKAGYMFRPELP
jgi:two-component system KDP operon response regulator KdpE